MYLSMKIQYCHFDIKYLVGIVQYLSIFNYSLSTESKIKLNKLKFELKFGAELCNKIGLLWCHSHVELRLIEVEVD